MGETLYEKSKCGKSWSYCDDMETISTLLAFCEDCPLWPLNPVKKCQEYGAYIFFCPVSMNKLLNKQSSNPYFDTLSGSDDVTVKAQERRKSKSTSSSRQHDWHTYLLHK